MNDAQPQHDPIQPLEQPPVTSRREVLTALAVYGCCMTVGAGSAQAADESENRVPAVTPGRSEIGPISDFAEQGIYDEHARSKQIFIVRDGDRLHAMSSICTHKRCVLRHRHEEAIVRCPCHQTHFDKNGLVLKPPAKLPLPHYAIEVAEGKLIVDTSKTFEQAQWDDPAASVTLTGGATTQPA